MSAILVRVRSAPPTHTDTPGDVKKRAIHYMVTPYMEHDLSGLLDNPDIRITEPQIKCYMQQIFKGLLYLHNVSLR